MKIKKRLMATVFLLLLCTAAHAANTLKETEITGIEIRDNAIEIKADAPIAYKIYHPDDPFRVSIDIEGARLGKFVHKIFPDHGGVTEIEPVQILNPVTVARFNLLLQSPATITPEVKDTTLVLTIKSDTKAAAKAVAEDESTPGDAILPQKISDFSGTPASDADGQSDTAEMETAAAEEIIELLFNKTSKGGELVLRGDGAMPEPAVFDLEGSIMIDIPAMKVSAPLPSGLVPPVKDFRYREEKDRLRFIVDLDPGAKASVSTLDDELVIDIASKGTTGKGVEAVQKTAGASGDIKKDGPGLVSFDVQDADIVAITRLLSDVSGYNIVVHPEVKGKVTMKLLNVPWEQALDIIMKTFGFEKITEGNVIRIATAKIFQDERKAIADAKEQAGNTADIETKVYIVNYANVDKVKETIEKAKILSPRGNLSTDMRTRSLIAKDVPSRLEEIQNLIAELDKPTPQVLIEARIIEVTKNSSDELGIQWSGNWSPTATKSSFDAVGSVGGSVPGARTSTPLVNLGTNGVPTGAITIGYLNTARTLGLDLRISALETSGRGRIVSNPKIMTVDNQKAVIRQGVRIPYQTSSANTGPVVQFIDASLDLIVTPQIGPDGTILLNIQANKNEADFSQTSQGMPSIRTSEATTQVLIKDGETVVIGGILKSTEQNNQDSVPGISKIPLLGALFKRNARTTSTDEQLVFITPRVVKQQ